MGFPAGVLQVQKCEQDLNAPQFVLLETLTDPKLFTKVIVLVALITLARLYET